MIGYIFLVPHIHIDFVESRSFCQHMQGFPVTCTETTGSNTWGLMTWWWGYKSSPLPLSLSSSSLPTSDKLLYLLLPLPHSSSFILHHPSAPQHTLLPSSFFPPLIQLIYSLKGGIRLWPFMTSAVIRPVCNVCVRANWCVSARVFIKILTSVCVHATVSCWLLHVGVCECVRHVYSC